WLLDVASPGVGLLAGLLLGGSLLFLAALLPRLLVETEVERANAVTFRHCTPYLSCLPGLQPGSHWLPDHAPARLPPSIVPQPRLSQRRVDAAGLIGGKKLRRFLSAAAANYV